MTYFVGRHDCCVTLGITLEAVVIIIQAAVTAVGEGFVATEGTVVQVIVEETVPVAIVVPVIAGYVTVGGVIAVVPIVADVIVGDVIVADVTWVVLTVVGVIARSIL